MGTFKLADNQTGNLAKYQSDLPFAVTRLDDFFNAIAGLIAVVTPSVVLNVGCGEGLDMKSIYDRLDARFAYGCGLDLRVEALKMASRVLIPYKFDVLQGDLYHLPLSLARFDLILCLEVLEHLSCPEQLLSDLSQRYSGHCLFSVPNEPAYRLTRLLLLRRNIRQLGNHPDHRHHWSKGGFARLMSEFFTVDQVVDPFPWTAVLCHSRARPQGQGAKGKHRLPTQGPARL